MCLRTRIMKTELMCHHQRYSEEQLKGNKWKNAFNTMSAESLWVAASYSDVHSMNWTRPLYMSATCYSRSIHKSLIVCICSIRLLQGSRGVRMGAGG